MAQPTLDQVHVNRPLTNVSVAFMQKSTNFIADKVFPIIPVEKQSDIYVVYTPNDWRRDEAQPRAPGSESAGSGFNLDNSNMYNATPIALHKDIDDQIRANADSMFNLNRDATQFITQKLMIKRERDWVANNFAGGIWDGDVDGVAGAPGANQFKQWSDYAASTPDEDVETGKATILGATGFEANTLVLGYDVFSKLKNHPVLKDQFKYTSSQSLTIEMMAAFFDVERVLVAKAIYASNPEKETEVTAFTHGKKALLCYSNPNPSLLSPSAGYTFAWKGVSQGMGATVGIKTFRMAHLNSDRVEGSYAWDTKVISASLGYFFDTAVA